MLASFPLPRMAGTSPASVTDAALVESLMARKPGASDVLFDRYGLYVERLIVRAVGFDPEVPDLVNEVFARALEGIKRLRDSSALKGWIGSIALLTARVFLRSRSTRRRVVCLVPPSDLADMPATLASPEVSQMLEHARALLDMLPANERNALALRLVDGVKLAEIAEIAGVSLATIKRRLARAERHFLDAARRDPLLRERVENRSAS